MTYVYISQTIMVVTAEITVLKCYVIQPENKKCTCN